MNSEKNPLISGDYEAAKENGELRFMKPGKPRTIIYHKDDRWVIKNTEKEITSARDSDLPPTATW